jgi:hypothetical protein
MGPSVSMKCGASVKIANRVLPYGARQKPAKNVQQQAHHQHHPLAPAVSPPPSSS